MGRVYLAEDEMLARRVAVKVVSERVASDPDARARFLREARAMAAVDHPHVLRVHAFGEADGVPYLVMEYVEGQSLSERLRREGPLAPEAALRLVRQVVTGLEAAWEKGLVHRDIKPSNLLLDARGNVRVADFGLAKALQGDFGGDASLTATGSIVGTPHYVSPEQALGRPLDFRSDVYSLGIVLYEMLTGARPFEGKTPVEVVAKQLHEPLPPLDGGRTPPPVATLVARMSAKVPGDRPPSYPALLGEIDAALAGRGASETRPGVARPATRWPATPRRGLLRVAVAGVAIAALGAVLWWRWPDIRDPVGQLAGPRGGGLAVAVAPFGGPDEDSAKEGRLVATLVERAVEQRLGGEGVRVLGVERTGEPVRDHAAARALGERLDAAIVVWGEVLSVRGESEIQPFFTLVPRKTGEPAKRGWGRDASLALEERAAGPVVVGAGVASQIEARKTSAAGIGDLVLVLAGVHALYAENRPAVALKLFAQAPRTAEALRYEAEALLRLGRPDEARRALERAIEVDPKDARSQSALADLDFETGRLADAVRRYEALGKAWPAAASRHLAPFEGKLYVREQARSPEAGLGPGLQTHDTGYLLALAPDGSVLERHRLPGTLLSLTPTAEGLEIASEETEGVRADTVHLSGGRIREPVFLGSSLLLRRRGIDGGQRLAFNFLDPQGGPFRPVSRAPGLPARLPELEEQLRQAIERDPTQPWHPFLLGQAAWSAGRREEAAALWEGLLAPGAFPAIPYYEYAHMAALCERFGQNVWSGRISAEAVRRRREMAIPPGPVWIIERLINTGFMQRASLETRDAELRHRWLTRQRELGLSPEADDLAAARWERHWAARGRLDAARAEAEVKRAAQAHPLNPAQHAARFDFALQVYATFLVSWLVLAAFAWRRARGRPWTHVERRALVTASLAVLLAACPLCVAAHRVERIASMPLGVSDAVGAAKVRGYFEERLAEHPTDAGRFVLACVDHLSGRFDEARRLYEALPGDARARRNLEAVRRGETSPPVWYADEDLFGAVASFSVRDLAAAAGGRTWEAVGFALDGDLENDPLGAAMLLLELALVLTAGVLLAFVLRPAADERTGARDPWRPLRLWLRTAGLALAPLAFLVQGDSLRLPSGGVGPLSATMRSALRAVALPPDRSAWDDLWVYRDAPAFWAVAVLLFLAAAASFVPGALRRPPPSEMPTQTRSAGSGSDRGGGGGDMRVDRPTARVPPAPRWPGGEGSARSHA
jgi:tetratricopeptide (TPR) repeat protein